MDVIEVASDVERFDFLEQAEKISRNKLAGELMYGVCGRPPVCLTLLLAVQNVITTIGGIIFVANVLAPKLCILPEDPARAYLLSTTILMAGISTLFQVLVGVRLPIVQNSGFIYMICSLSVLSLPKWQCLNNVDLFTMGPDARTQEWQLRVREIQGAIIITGLIQMMLGYSGIVSKALKYITPLTIVPTMCIIGLSVIEKGVFFMSGNWTTAIVTIFLLTLFSQYLRKVAISFPAYSITKGLVQVRLKIFALFSILLSVSIMWVVCIYLTSKNNLLPTDPANTESKSGVFNNALMFRFPYPFQWGLPTFSVTSIFSMLPTLFTSVVESVGNYYTCAKFSNLTLPPKSAVNRGVGIQGISLILAGFLGTGTGVSASGENVGNIGITQVCSRNVIVYVACIMILISPFTKLIALLVTLPDPVLGAVTSILLVLITAVALSNLQFIDLNSIRNMYILGMSIFSGLILPWYVSNHDRFFKTKYEIVNDVFYVYMTSGMFIGGLLGFILDNTIPDDEENMFNAYYASDNDLKISIDVEDENVYKISDKLYEKINTFLTFFV